jgi:hypothetical protein
MFAGLLVTFLMVAFFRAPRLSGDQRSILKFLSALCAAFSGIMIAGDALFRLNRSGNTQLAVSGTAGFALFFVVWFFFPKPPRQDTSMPKDRFSLKVTDNWTFQQTVDALARDDNAVAEYIGFTTQELSSTLKSWAISTETVRDAMLRLRSITTTPGAIRDYSVTHGNGAYRLQVR